MHIVGSTTDRGGAARRVTPVEVADLELRGTWVVDVRRAPGPERHGWLLTWEDDIAFLADSPDVAAEEASELVWPSFPLDAA